jgi:hypothetical protein
MDAPINIPNKGPSKFVRVLQIAAIVITPAVIGGTIYFGFVKRYKDGRTGWEKITKKNPPAGSGGGSGNSDTSSSPIRTSSKSTSSSSSGSSSGFPLNTSSKVDSNVKKLQHALNQLPVVPPFTANNLVEDGILGTKTAAAIKAAGYSLPLSQDSFNKIVNPPPASSYGPFTGADGKISSTLKTQ